MQIILQILAVLSSSALVEMQSKLNVNRLRDYRFEKGKVILHLRYIYPYHICFVSFKQNSLNILKHKKTHKRRPYRFLYLHLYFIKTHWLQYCRLKMLILCPKMYVVNLREDIIAFILCFQCSFGICYVFVLWSCYPFSWNFGQRHPLAPSHFYTLNLKF